MYKSISKIHLWLSVPFGILLALICATGLILLFEPTHAHGDPRPEFFLDVMRLHRWLFNVPAVKGAMTPGKMIVAISTCVMILIIISGITLWCIRARKNLSNQLKLSLHKGISRFFVSIHTSGGIYVAIFLLTIALTGLTWSFGWYRQWFNTLFGIAKGSHIIYEIHTGSFGGIFTKIVWFIAVLTGFTLPLSGYYIWIKRILLKRNKNNRSVRK